MDSAKQIKDLNKVYLEAVYGKSPEKVEAERRKKDNLAGSPLVVTNADKKANTKAYQNLKAGVKGYKAADHMKESKKADKDYDGDGKIESGTDEYMGSKDKAIKKALGKEVKDLKKAAETGKGEYVAKADKVKGVGESRWWDVSKEDLQEKESYDTVAAVIDYDRSKKGTGEAVKDTEKGDKKAAKKERDYAAFEREKMKKADPNWEHKKGSTSESVDAEYIEIVREIKSAETQADIKRWGALKESGNFTDEELDTIVEADIADILARLEKKRISKGGDPEESPLPAMRKYHANKKKVKEEVEIELDEAERSLSDRLARKQKLYKKTTKKALEYARREGEAAGHARYRMGSIDREMDGIKAKMNKEN